MHIQLQIGQVPKMDLPPEKCEDAVWPEDTGTYDASPFRCAVGDGVTEAWAARSWARTLVRAYGGQDLDRENCGELLEGLKSQWREEHRPDASAPWYARPKWEAGSGSTLLGLTLYAGGGRIRRREPMWRALAVGDSCLMHVRDDMLSTVFPIEQSTDFGNTPTTISTRQTDPSWYEEHFRTKEGTWKSGDQFLLMTDALATWFLRRVEEKGHPWRDISNLDWTDPEAFGRWIADLRKRRLVRDDDVALLRVLVS